MTHTPEELDALVRRLERADEYEPVGHDAWQAAGAIKALRAKLASGSFYQEKDVDAMRACITALEAQLATPRAALLRALATDENIAAIIERAGK